MIFVEKTKFRNLLNSELMNYFCAYMETSSMSYGVLVLEYFF